MEPEGILSDLGDLAMFERRFPYLEGLRYVRDASGPRWVTFQELVSWNMARSPIGDYDRLHGSHLSESEAIALWGSPAM